MPTTLPAPLPLTLPNATNPHSIGFSPDGQSLYFMTEFQQLDPWSLLTYHWPELLLALWTMLALRGLLRLIRRKQDPLHDYCRKCNYSLHALTTDTCPECGLALAPRNRVSGRRHRPKLLAAFLLPVVLYPLLNPHLPRTGQFSRWFDLRSQYLADVATKSNKGWLKRHLRFETYLMRLDTNAGNVRTRTRLQTDPANSRSSVSLSRDGRSVFVLYTVKDPGGGWAPELVQYDVNDGRVTRTFPRTWMPAAEAHDVLFAAVSDFGPEPSTLHAFDAHTGALINRFPIDSMRGVLPIDNGVIVAHRPDTSTGPAVRFDFWEPRAHPDPRLLCSAFANDSCIHGGRLVLHRRTAGRFTFEFRSLATGDPLDSIESAFPDGYERGERFQITSRGGRLLLIEHDLPDGTSALFELNLPQRHLLPIGSAIGISPQHISPAASTVLSGPKGGPFELRTLPPPPPAVP